MADKNGDDTDKQVEIWKVKRVRLDRRHNSQLLHIPHACSCCMHSATLRGQMCECFLFNIRGPVAKQICHLVTLS